MLPAKLDFNIYKSSEQNKPMQWKSGDPLLPVNITGCIIQVQIRPNVDSSVVIDTLTVANGRITIDNAINGEFTLHFPSESTASVEQSTAVYDIEVIYPGGTPKYTIVYGKITYIKDVTKL